MSRIEWTRLPGEDVEAVVGMLLCSVYPNAWRIRPGRGDGGVDIFVPLDPARRHRKVFQVKRYASNLTSSQKREITRSFNRVVKSADEDGWAIDSWTLVMPLDPTPPNETWFTTLTGSAGFPCDWMGLNAVEYSAAQNPKIVDYYLHDGRERLQEQTDRLAGILAGRQGRSAGEPLQPIDVTSDLLDIYRAINEHDPHYRYEVSMTAQSPVRTGDERPGLVAVVGYGAASNGWVNISIFATSLAALEERPLNGNLTIYPPEVGTELADHYRMFLDYGTPLHLPEGQSLVNFPLPGGLGINDSGGRLFIESFDETDPTEPTPEFVIGVLSPDGDTVSEVEIERVERSQGINGGYRTVWHDRGHILRIEIRVSPDGNGTINVLHEGDANGRVPGEVVGALEFWSHAHAPNLIGLSRAYGPREYEAFPTGELTRDPDSEMKALARSARNLTIIQARTVQRLLLPPSMTADEARSIHAVAQIVAGQPVTATWSEFDVNLHPDNELALAIGDEIMVSIIQDLDFELGGVTVSAGKSIYLLSGQVSLCTETTLRITPLEGTGGHAEAVQVRFDGEEEPGRVLYKPLDEDQRGS